MVCTPAISSLYQAAARTAKKVDVELPEEARGGASDANFLAATNLPTLDGLGPVGGMDHSKNERILKNSLFQRVELLVHLLWDLRNWTP
jgi:glutamate carboxypeptidase